jgi:uncharacterized Zn finger protein (UPF0148 family)
MKRWLTLRNAYRVAVVAAAVALVALFAVDVFGRVGGGHSYSGGSRGGSSGSRGGGGSGDGGAIVWLIFEALRLLVYLTINYPLIGIPLDIVLIVGIGFFLKRRARSVTAGFSSMASTMPSDDDSYSSEIVTSGFERLKKFDPNFSEIVFTDFCYALYGKAHDARGGGKAKLDLFSPYLSEETRASLLQRNSPSLQAVKGIIVGAMKIEQIQGLETPLVSVGLRFDSNYTEVLGQSEMTYYVVERWQLERKRDVLSPTPAQATALHCPRCGAPLQRDTVGACAFCGTKIDSGEFQWFVRSISFDSKEARGPQLTSNVEEVGTDYPSVVQPNFEAIRADFERNNPEFNSEQFQERARLIFNELQAAWSTMNWERARPHETDNLFQMHQYWIEAYRRQKLRNIIDKCEITAMESVKIQEDAFYQGITLRIWAQGLDYTVDSTGIVSGSNQRLREWSEYWTFIRSKQAKSGKTHTDLNCPNCGSPLKVNATGICEFCGGKITSGEFDWVLSKIEQDESYSG